MGLPNGQGQRSIQIEGLRVPCELLQAPGDQHGLGSRSQRCARAYIRPSVASMVAAQPLRAASVEGMYQPKFHSQEIGWRTAGLGWPFGTPVCGAMRARATTPEVEAV